MTDSQGDRYDVRADDVSGQLVVGRDNTVTRLEVASAATTPVTERELAELHAEFARVRALVPQDAPEADRARELLDELEESATAPDADGLSTMAYVRRWFSRHLPALTEAVTGLVVHPVVIHLVELAGGAVADEFHQRFGA
ncbi:hypothetical protein [Streptomyces sp. NPDC001381]|uniref:hypothetical protein n=1 Tax=Streptomyces sp. NPDC001381 TaxID=3364567 RepID=UPI00368ED348